MRFCAMWRHLTPLRAKEADSPRQSIPNQQWREPNGTYLVTILRQIPLGFRQMPLGFRHSATLAAYENITASQDFFSFNFQYLTRQRIYRRSFFFTISTRFRIIFKEDALKSNKAVARGRRIIRTTNQRSSNWAPGLGPLQAAKMTMRMNTFAYCRWLKLIEAPLQDTCYPCPRCCSGYFTPGPSTRPSLPASPTPHSSHHASMRLKRRFHKHCVFTMVYTFSWSFNIQYIWILLESWTIDAYFPYVIKIP